MGVFGIDTYREPSLIPPDPPEPEPVVERNGRVVRTQYPDGEVSWDVRGLNRGESSVLNGMRDEALENAYELGQQSMEDQIRLLKSALASVIKQRDEARDKAGEAWGAGVIAAAQTAYGGKR